MSSTGKVLVPLLFTSYFQPARKPLRPGTEWHCYFPHCSRRDGLVGWWTPAGFCEAWESEVGFKTIIYRINQKDVRVWGGRRRWIYHCDVMLIIGHPACMAITVRTWHIFKDNEIFSQFITDLQRTDFELCISLCVCSQNTADPCWWLCYWIIIVSISHLLCCKKITWTRRNTQQKTNA